MDVVSYQMTDTDIEEIQIRSLKKTKTEYLVVQLEQNCHDYLRRGRMCACGADRKICCIQV